MKDSTISTSRFKFDKLWVLIGVGVLIRLAFIGFLNLLPEEAYYWNYAKHLDIGYLDHPPMVAWLNYLSGLILGRTQLAVRLAPFLGWFIFAYFMYRFAENAIGRGIGKPVVLLLAALPIYMSVGFIMTPDAPLYVCWAGTLYFLERAIFGNRSSAWYLAGVWLGLGFLSKYTMGLIVPAAVIFVLIDKNARRWLLRPQPYLALLIAAVIFLPDIIWNAQHNWASFGFQGARRWSGGAHFQLHVLIGSILILITPFGLYEAIRVCWSFWKTRLSIRAADSVKFRKYLFMVTLTAAPLAVFVIHSLQGQPKLNWTGPVWLGILPLIAARISGFRIAELQIKLAPIGKLWSITVYLLLIFYAVGFGYMVAGMPGTHKGAGMKLPIAWQAYGERVQSIKSRLDSETQSNLLIVGTDKYWLASEASFYCGDDSDSLPKFAGENLVGGNGLMWKYWVPPQVVAGRNALLLSFTDGRLKEHNVTDHFAGVGEISKEVLSNRFGETGFFYWRVGYSYKPD
jgi:dolichol-phosphate mannosyltransferase